MVMTKALHNLENIAQNRTALIAGTWAKYRRGLILVFMAAFLYTVNGYWLVGYWITGYKKEIPAWKKSLFYPSLILSNYLGFRGSRWTVFCPNITHASHYIYVVGVTGREVSQNGNKVIRVWVYPCEGRYVKFGEIFRKYSEYSDTKKADLLLMRNLCCYVAKEFESKGFHPAQICIVRQVQNIPLPMSSLHSTHPQSLDQILFVYRAT
jgi:hypothetical protein